MRTFHLSLLVAAMLLAAPASAATLRVPSEYSTIRAAVEAAVSGDEILLAPGHYTGDGNKGIQVSGMSLSVRSEAGAEATVIDGEGAPGWCLRVGLGADDLVTISGIEFTLFDALGGSALRVSGDGEVVVEDCRFVRCAVAEYDPEGNGGAAVVIRNQVRSTIRRCKFEWNTAPSGPSALEVSSAGPMTIENCGFVASMTSAMTVGDSSTSVAIVNSDFIGNGATISAYAGDVEVVNCSFVNNGSGIFSYADLTVRGSTFARTEAIGVYRGSLYAENSILSDGCPGSGIEAHAPVTLVCCALDSTRVEGWEHITLIGEQVWEDPLFCEPEPCGGYNLGGTDYYRLHSDSPCVWWRSPCGVRIGSLDVGCGAAGIGACCLEEGCFLAPQGECEAAGGMFEGAGTTCEPSPCGVTPTVPMSWGTIKQLFR